MAKQLFNNPDGRRGSAVINLPMAKVYEIVKARIENMCMGEQSIDPDAVCQNVCVEIEKAMGTYPNIGAIEPAPEAVTTFRSEAKGKASAWTPRQAIMHALTKLDDDNEPVTRVLIIIGHIDDEDESETSMICATKNAYETMGMLVSAMKAETA